MTMKTRYLVPLLCSFLMACGVAWGAVPSISVRDADKLRGGAVQFVDVREEYQFIGWDSEEGPGGHIAGAMDFPASWVSLDVKPGTIDTELTRRGLKKEVKTVLYGNGSLEPSIVDRYAELGFGDLAVLEGGYRAWMDAGLPTERLKHYEILVYPRWVEELAAGKNPPTFKGGDFKIVEVYLNDKGKDVYLKGHIPGAVALDDSLNHVRGPRTVSEIEALPHGEQLRLWNRPSDEVIRQKLESLGITADTTVVLYGSEAATTAAYRCGLILRYAGVKDVRFLNGGRPLWEAEGRPLESGEVPWGPSKEFGAKIPQNPRIIIDYDEELKLVSDPKAVIASIRSWDEYLGNKSGYTYIGEAGDVANSRFGYAGSDPYAMEDYRNLDNTMFNADLMAARWRRWGIVPDKVVSFHCGTGWRASETYFCALAMGWSDIKVYDGGWYEWHKIPDSPRRPEGLPDDAPERSPESFFAPAAR